MEIGMKNRMLVCLSALSMIGVVSCEDSTDPVLVNNTVTFTATMTPGAEVPAVTGSTGTGTFTAVLDTVTNIMTYDVTFSGLTSGVTVGHIHGPADATVAASPILTYNNNNGQQFSTGVTSGTAHGTALLTSANVLVQPSGTSLGVKGDSLRKLLFAGKTYANVHTSNNTGGEIRGQITLKTP
jgi:hypothetical protein